MGPAIFNKGERHIDFVIISPRAYFSLRKHFNVTPARLHADDRQRATVNADCPLQTRFLAPQSNVSVVSRTVHSVWCSTPHCFCRLSFLSAPQARNKYLTGRNRCLEQDTDRGGIWGSGKGCLISQPTKWTVSKTVPLYSRVLGGVLTGNKFCAFSVTG